MSFYRSPKEAGPVAAAELCIETKALDCRSDTLTLEQTVTAYFEQWRTPVHRYLVAAFGDRVEAEEITQEAFLQLYRELHRGQLIIKVRPWLFRTAHNMAVNRIKGQQFVELLDENSWRELCESLVDVSPNPEQRLLKLEKFSRLRTALGRLTPAERQCLHLRTNGLRYREIAEILSLSLSTVAETLYRVIGKLTRESNG